MHAVRIRPHRGTLKETSPPGLFENAFDNQSGSSVGDGAPQHSQNFHVEQSANKEEREAVRIENSSQYGAPAPVNTKYLRSNETTRDWHRSHFLKLKGSFLTYHLRGG